MFKFLFEPNIYVNSELKNPKYKEYRYILQLLGGAKKIKNYILEHEPSVKYISERQIKNLGGRKYKGISGVGHKIPKESKLIIIYLMKLYKKFEKDILTFDINNQKNNFKFCIEIDIDCNQTCIDQLLPSIDTKLEQIIRHSKNNAKINLANNIYTDLQSQEINNLKC